MIFFWLAAVFITILSSKLWIIDLFGSSLPWWDQWVAEAWALYIPFFEHKLALKDLLAAHCEHRIFVNRVLSLIALILNGQWDARLGMTLNAFITAFTGVALSFIGWKILGRKHLAVLCLFNALVFSLPFSWESSIIGLMGNYLLIVFALLAVRFLLKSDPFSGSWFLGLFFAALGLVTMASGFVAALAVVAIVLLRLVMRKGSAGRNLFAVFAMGAIVAAGLLLRVNVPCHEAFKPSDLSRLIIAFAGNLAWPNSNLPWSALIIWLPCLLMFAVYVFRGSDNREAFELIMGLGLWVALQNAALASSRYDIITSRHTVVLCLSLPVNLMALLFLVRAISIPPLLRKFTVILFLVWLGWVGQSLWKISDKAHLAEAASLKQHFTQCEKNVRAFLKSNDISALTEKPLYDIPFADPNALAILLRNPHIRPILPACVTPDGRQGPLSFVISKAIPKGDKLLIIGVALLAIMTTIRFYQSLGTLEKRIAGIRWTDARPVLIKAGIGIALAGAAAALTFGMVRLYSLLSPHGLKVTYFRGINFEKKICSRVEQAVCRDYDEKPPAWRVPKHYYSAIWQGILRVPETGEYTFFSQSDDGIRLIIDGNKIIEAWRDQSWQVSAIGAHTNLAAGDHAIAVEHYNGEGESALRIKWCGGPVPPNTILAAPYLRKRK